MAWVRIHDGVMQNAKIAALSDGAFRLWVNGLCYCQVALTDGFIPTKVVKRDASRDASQVRHVRELTRSQLPGRAPLWRPVKGGFQVHDYLEWNDAREEIVRKRRDKSLRNRKWRDASQARHKTRSQRGTTTTTTSTEKYSAADAAPHINGRVLERLCYEIEVADRANWADVIDALKTHATKNGVPYNGDALTRAVTKVAHARSSPFAHLVRH